MASRGRGRPTGTISFKAYQKHYREIMEKSKDTYSPKPVANQFKNAKQYRVMYNALLNERKEEIAAGKRKSIGDINKGLAERQIYQMTGKQARAIHKGIQYALKESGYSPEQLEAQYGVYYEQLKKLKVKDLRFMDKKSDELQFFWDYYDKAYQELTDPSNADFGNFERDEAVKILKNDFFGGDSK